MTGAVGDDDNSPWRPDAGVDFDHPAVRSFPTPQPVRTPRVGCVLEADPDGVDDGGGPDDVAGVASSSARVQAAAPPSAEPPVRRTRRRAAVGSAAAVLLAAGSVAVSRGDPPEGDLAAPTAEPNASSAVDIADLPRRISTPTVCSESRLPATAVERWLAPIPTAIETIGPLVAGAGGVAALTRDSDGGQRLGFFEADDGAERWTVTGSTVDAARRIVGVLDGVVLLEGGTDAPGATGGDSGTSLSAFDAAAGFRSWTQRLDVDADYTIHGPSATFVVGFADPSGNLPGLVGAFDVSTGSLRATGVGRFVSLDADGRLVTVAGGKVLASTADPPADELLGVVGPAGTPFAVLGSTVVMPADDRPGGLFVAGGVAGSAGSVRLVGVEDLDDAPIGSISSITPLGETSLVLTSNGAVVGVELVDDRFEARWSVDGVLLAWGPSDRGATLVVAGDGGATQSLVDAATGVEFLAAPTVSGGLTDRSVFSNGVLVSGGTGSGESRTAYDLDGRRLWGLPGRADLAVGDGLAYEWSARTGTATEPAITDVAVRAIGDGPAGAECVVAPDPLADPVGGSDR